MLKRLFCIEEYDKQNRLTRQLVRTFFLPELNFKANNYVDLCKFKIEKSKGPGNAPDRVLFRVQGGSFKEVTMPPALKDFTWNEIEDIKYNKLHFAFPCHGQGVEHGVAVTTEAVHHRRTQKHQLESVLQVVNARSQCKGRVTHKRYRDGTPV